MTPHVLPLPGDTAVEAAGPLRLRRLGIDTYLHPVAYLRSDSPVCRSEGFESQTRIQVSLNGTTMLATLNVVHFDLVGLDEIGLSEAAWNVLGGKDGDAVVVTHPPPVASFSTVRAKIYGRPLEPEGAQAVIADLVAGRYSEIETAALIAACSGGRLDVAETTARTHAMVNSGRRLHWNAPVVADKHCVGGLPGSPPAAVKSVSAACEATLSHTYLASLPSSELGLSRLLRKAWGFALSEFHDLSELATSPCFRPLAKAY